MPDKSKRKSFAGLVKHMFEPKPRQPKNDNALRRLAIREVISPSRSDLALHNRNHFPQIVSSPPVSVGFHPRYDGYDDDGEEILSFTEETHSTCAHRCPSPSFERREVTPPYDLMSVTPLDCGSPCGEQSNPLNTHEDALAMSQWIRAVFIQNVTSSIDTARTKLKELAKVDPALLRHLLLEALARGWPINFADVFASCREELEEVLLHSEKDVFETLLRYGSVYGSVTPRAAPSDNVSVSADVDEEKDLEVVAVADTEYEEFLASVGLEDVETLSTFRQLKLFVDEKQDPAHCPAGFLGKLVLTVGYLSGIGNEVDRLLSHLSLRESEARSKFEDVREYFRSHPNKKLKQYMQLGERYSAEERNTAEQKDKCLSPVDKNFFVYCVAVVALEAEQISTYQLRALKLVRLLLAGVVSDDRLKATIQAVKEVLSGPSNLQVRRACKVGRVFHGDGRASSAFRTPQDMERRGRRGRRTDQQAQLLHPRRGLGKGRRNARLSRSASPRRK